MKFCFLLIGIVAVLGFVQDKQAFSPLYALQGIWAREKANTILYESWQKVADDVMQGKSYTLSGKDTAMVEIMQLEYQHGKIIFTAIDAQHKEQGPTSFTLTKAENRSYYFENPGHDYPKRIVYELPSRDSLHAWIDGGEMEKDSRVDFYFKRMR